MKHSPKDEDRSSREEYIEREEKPCNALHTLHTLHEKNDQIQVRMRKSLHRGFMKYCALTNMTAGQFYERAGVLYIDLNPPPAGNLLIISEPEQRTNLRDRMMNQMCVQELQGLVDSLDSYHAQSLPYPKKVMEGLCRVFDKSYKIVNPSDELNALVEEALKYVE